MSGLIAQVMINGMPLHPLVLAAVAAGALFGWLWIIGKMIALLRNASLSPEPQRAAPVAQVGLPNDEGERRRLIAVIAAAATAAVGRRVVVRRITFINQNTVSGWAEAGRLSIQSSHNVRR